MNKIEKFMTICFIEMNFKWSFRFYIKQFLKTYKMFWIGMYYLIIRIALLRRKIWMVPNYYGIQISLNTF